MFTLLPFKFLLFCNRRVTKAEDETLPTISMEKFSSMSLNNLLCINGKYMISNMDRESMKREFCK